MVIGIADKVLMPWLKKNKNYITAADEGEAIGIAGGYYYATGRRATVFMSADGFMNALNPITSWAIPEKVKMKLVISIGRKERQHYVATEIIPDIIDKLQSRDLTGTISYKFITKE